MSDTIPGLPSSTPSNSGNPPRRNRSLANFVLEGFHQKMQAGQYKAGDKLPTESELMRVYDVSRTVIREALSKLQAAGLVETRHGIGTFIIENNRSSGFQLDASQFNTSVDVISVLELRISLETESAGLAAVRRTPENLANMRAALDRFAQNLLEDSQDTVASDLAFHLQIAQATGNRYFVDIMQQLGTALIPRARITATRNANRGPDYLTRVNREHEEIYAAIERRDADSARAAMRIHLTNSRERLRQAQEALRAG